MTQYSLPGNNELSAAICPNQRQCFYANIVSVIENHPLYVSHARRRSLVMSVEIQVQERHLESARFDTSQGGREVREKKVMIRIGL
jgi:hypothetical protein